MSIMLRMRLTFILGTAAELIKVYPVARRARERGHGIHFLATGQSRDNFLMQYEDFHLDPKDLSWLVEGTKDLETSKSALQWFMKATWHALFKRGRLKSQDLDFVVVHGDTLSTLIGALFGWRRKIRVVHIEAGLRSNHLFHPFPEEVTRRLVSHLASVHMAPDARALKQLSDMNGVAFDTGGNTLVDAVQQMAEPSPAEVQSAYAVVNVHRFENLNSPERWKKIGQTLIEASQKWKLVIVLHPQTRHQFEQHGELKADLERLGCEFRERMPFSAFIELLKGAQFLISDGGSNQEECFYLGKPCLLLRLSTERLEGLKGCCLLSRFEPELIAEFLSNPQAYAREPEIILSGPSDFIIRTLEGL